MKTPSLALVALSALSATALAEPLPERLPFIKFGGDEPRFGQSVSIDGRWAIVGTYLEDNGGEDQGSTYVFDVVTGQQLWQLTASDAEDGDYFGASVAIEGNLAIIGAFLEDGDGGAGANRGAAYVFDLSTGRQLRKLTASDAEDGDIFGYSVALSGGLAIVGAYQEDGAGGADVDRGAAYVFDLSTGQQLAKLTASDPENGDLFGYSVAISGELAIVGAFQEDGAGGNARGAAYVFDLSTGQQLAKLNASDAEDGDLFGYSVAISGDLAIVGAFQEDGAGASGANRGAAYVFDLSTGRQIRKLTASDAEDGDFFGGAVAIEGKLAIVSAPLEDGEGGAGANRGAAYVFDLSTGQQLAKLTASDAANGDVFGNSVALSGRRALVGAPIKNGKEGAAYVYGIPDYQPDNSIGRTSLSGAGRRIYNTTGAGQLLDLVSLQAQVVRGFLCVENAGTHSDSYRLHGSAGNATFAVAYFRRVGTQRLNATAAMLAGTQRVFNITPGSKRLYEVQVTPNRAQLLRRQRVGTRIRTFYLRQTIPLRLTATSEKWAFRKDTAILRGSTR